MAFADSFRAARWLKTINLVLQSVLFLSLFAGLNYISLHFSWRFDLTKFQKHSLSAETRSYLSQLDRPVLIVITFTATAEDEKYRQAFEDVRQILREYSYVTEANERGKIRITTLDVFQRPRDAQQIGAEQNQVIVHDEESGRTRIIRFEELYQFREGRRAAFRGEQAITSAILDVSSNNRKKVYFIAGHGELDPSDTAPDRGISVLANELSMRNFELERLHLNETRKVPDDASLLLVVRPTTAFEPVEEELLRQYLSTRAGRLLLLVDPQAHEHGLDDLLYDWGILADRAVIWDSGPTGQNDGSGLVLKQFSEHPVTRSLIEQDLQVSFGFARPVRRNPSRASDESLTVTPLIGTRDSAWGERNFTQATPQYDPGIDLQGKNLTVGVASERVGAKADLSFSVPRGRIVALGCADFVSNSRIAATGNMTLVLSAVNWLVDRDTQLNVAPRPIETFQLALSQEDLLRIRYTLLFGLPAAVGLLGLVVYWTRRR